MVILRIHYWAALDARFYAYRFVESAIGAVLLPVSGSLFVRQTRAKLLTVMASISIVEPYEHFVVFVIVCVCVLDVYLQLCACGGMRCA